jgi:hypothetical protein
MFLNPFMLFAAAGIAGPIVIHLLNRRRIDRIQWAAMRFLQDAVKQNQRRMNIEDLLLLILRCLIIALIALAMSRPAIRSSIPSLFGQSTVTAAIVIDNSASTALTDGTISRFDQSKKIARQIVSTMPHGSRVAVYLASDVLTPLIAEPTTDLALVTSTIDQAKRSDRSSDLLPAIAGTIDLLQRQPALRKELYVLSDNQALAFRHADEIHNRLAAAADSIHATFITDAANEARNLAVTGLSLDNTQLPAVDTPLAFDVQVTNASATAEKNISVKLEADGKSACAPANIAEIPPHESRSVTMVATISSPGFHTVTASIPHDRLPADDQRTIALRVVKQCQVLIVADDTTGQPPAANAAFYLRHALVPVPPADRENYVIHTTTITPSQFENAKLADASVVVLAGVAAPSAAATTALTRYVSNGGGLMIFPGLSTDPDVYNQRPIADLLPARFGPLRDTTLALQAGGYTHPIVTLWNDPAAGTLSSARFSHSFELAPVEGDAKSPATTVLSFSDHSPAVISRRLGLGEVILFASSANIEWNDLPLHPAFVPLMHRVVGQLAQRTDANLNLTVGDPFSMQTAADLIGKDATIFQPGDAREMTRVDLADGMPSLSFTGTNLAGVYTVSIGGKTDEAVFATQIDPAESDLTPASTRTQEAIASVAKVIKYDGSMDVADAVRTDRIGKELWLFLGIAALLFASSEMLLANAFSQPK